MKFDTVASFLDEKLSTPMARLSEQRHLRAIRDGIIATLPLIIVSSMFLVIAFLPNQLPADWGVTQFIKANAVKILLPYRMSMYIMSLYAVFGIGYSLARSYKLDGLSGGILSELAFLLTIVPTMMPDPTDALTSFIKANPDMAAIGDVAGAYVIPATNLGSAGMFVGIICAFFAVEVYRFTQHSKFHITMPDQVPESVARSFEALTPTIIVLLIMSTITMWLGFDLHSLISTIIRPLISATDTLPFALLVVFLEMFFWSFGIHGSSVVYSLACPLWTSLLEQNTTAFAAGSVAPHIAAEPFFQWFVQIGGSGCTIGLALLFLFAARSKYLKLLGRTGIIPVIFNINEPIIFGTPLILNPSLAIPFICIPLINVVIAWVAMSLGLVGHVVAMAPWTLPGPVGAFLATGGDWRAAVLSVFLIVLSIVLYYPFFKMFDNKLLTEEEGEEEPEVKAGIE